MRYREKVNQYKDGTFNIVENAGSAVKGWRSTTPKNYIQQQQYVAMLDVVTPNWRKLIAKGFILNNPMLSVTYTSKKVPVMFTGSGVFFSLPAPNNWLTFTTGVIIPEAFGAVSLDWDVWNESYFKQYQSDRDIALSKAWANVDVSGIQALASLGEMPETLHYMASLLTRMISLLRAFSQKRLLITASKFLRSGKSVIDAMSDLWLEFRYAVRPLIFDMKQAMETWNAVLDKSDRFTGRGFNRIELSSKASTYQLNDPLAQFFNTSFIVSRVETLEANFRAGVLFTLDSDIKEIRSLWGLDQPFETIWELIPFSFIIDWFFSVGNVISSWTMNPGLTPLASWCTEIYSVQTIDTLSGFIPTSNSTYSLRWNDYDITPGSTVTTQLVKRRLTAPKRAILPTFKLNLDTAKLIDLATIGRNIFRSL